MAFSDEVKKNLANAPGAAARAAQERFQRTVDGICNTIRDVILSESKRHTNPRIPFRVELCVAADDRFAFKSQIIEQRRPSFLNSTRAITEVTVSDEMVTLRKAVKSQLARDGIQVGEWLLCDNYLTCDSSSYISQSDYHQIYKLGQAQLKVLNINPNITFRRRDYQTAGAMSTHYRTEYSQGNARFDFENSNLHLVFVVKYQ